MKTISQALMFLSVKQLDDSIYLKPQSRGIVQKDLGLSSFQYVPVRELTEAKKVQRFEKSVNFLDELTQRSIG